MPGRKRFCMVNQKGSYDLLLKNLDRFIRKFYLNQLIKGSLFSTGIILGIFLVFSLLENYFYFDKPVRKLLFFGFLMASGISLYYFLLVPLLKYFSLGKRINHEQAASIIGDHFSDVKDQLLNILQLKKQSESSVSAELIEASIQQKTEKIKLVPFPAAIDLRNNRKYLRYALPPAMILMGIFLASPTMITKPTHRIINNNVEFEREAPFSFDILNSDLEVVQYDDYELQVRTVGDIVPAELFIELEDFQYRMKKLGDDMFSYTFSNVQKSTEFELYSAKVRSKKYALDVLLKPKLSEFEVELDYPSYLGRKDESVKNTGDLVVPQGTQVSWRFVTEHTNQLGMRFGENDSVIEAEQRSDNSFMVEKRVMNVQFYKVYYSNAQVSAPDSVSYTINVLPDEYPEISVESFQDRIESKLVYFVGNASDDYGVVSVFFNYTVESDTEGTRKDKVLISQPRQREADYSYTLDISEFELKPGDRLSYYFETFDNDAVNGSKSARSSITEYEKPTLEEFEEKEDQNEEDIKDKLEESVKESKRIREELRKLREKMLQKQQPDWEDKKELEKLMQRQDELQKQLQEAQQKFEENLRNQEEFSERQEEIREKQENLQELFEEAMDSETQELMQKIQELMEELDKETMVEELENMEISEEAMQQNTERLLELFKTLEVEKEIQDMIEKLEEMSEKQDSLSDMSKEEESSPEDLKEEQEKLNEEFEKMQEKMDDIQKKNEELERPKDLGDEPKEKMDDIMENMEDSQQSLEEQQKKKASKQQKNAAQKMKEMAEGMQSAMAALEMEQMQEDIAALRQLLENLVTLSFDQEDLIEDIKRTRINTPRYVGQIQEQFKLKDDFGMINDSLQALAKRVDKIQSFVLEKVAEVETEMKASIDQLEEREKPEAEANQRRVMKNVNDLALMLSESMEEMQQQMSSMMMGSQMCNKPGGMGGKPGDVPMDKITEGQKELSEDMKEMMEKKGSNGKGGSSGMSAKDFAEAAARQAALRKALAGIQQQKMEQGKGDKSIQELIDAMDKIETDLVNKRLDNDMLLRQQDILTRLLEAEKAERQREYDNQRKAETGKEYKKELPPQLQEYLRKREAELNMYNKVSPSLRPYYKRMVNEYYKALKNS